jgi:hypothetical protein
MTSIVLSIWWDLESPRRHSIGHVYEWTVLSSGWVNYPEAWDSSVACLHFFSGQVYQSLTAIAGVGIVLSWHTHQLLWPSNMYWIRTLEASIFTGWATIGYSLTQPLSHKPIKHISSHNTESLYWMYSLANPVYYKWTSLHIDMSEVPLAICFPLAYSRLPSQHISGFLIFSFLHKHIFF